MKALSRRVLLGTASALIAAHVATALPLHGTVALSSYVPVGATVLNNITDLTNALTSGPAGANYLLAPGNWGNLDFSATRTGALGTPITIYGQLSAKINFISCANMSNVTWSHCITLSNTGGGAGFTAYKSTNINFDHCLSKGSTFAGFLISASNNCYAKWCKAYAPAGNGFAVVTSKGDPVCNNILVEDCWCTGSSSDGFDMFGCTDVVVNRCLDDSHNPDAGHPDSFQIADGPSGGPSPARITVMNCNYDVGLGSGGQGPVLVESADHVTVQNCASFGVFDNNGCVFNACTNCVAQNLYIQIFPGFQAPTVIVRGMSDTILIDTIRAIVPPVNYAGDGPNTNVTITNYIPIAAAASVYDRSGYVAYCAANGIPLQDHWAGVSWGN